MTKHKIVKFHELLDQTKALDFRLWGMFEMLEATRTPVEDVEGIATGLSIVRFWQV